MTLIHSEAKGYLDLISNLPSLAVGKKGEGMIAAAEGMPYHMPWQKLLRCKPPESIE
jgi:hypothetical protein